MRIGTRTKFTVSVLLSVFLLTACSTQLSDYETKSTSFDLQNYFSGPVVAWGMVQDYSGKVTRRFCVEMVGTWQKQEGTDVGLLAEDFYFDDGEFSERDWNLRRVKGTEFVGTASDVVGQASGSSQDFAFRWQYSLNLEVDGDTYTFFLDDWIYQIDEYRAFNRTKVKKFGLTVAELTLFFDKQTPIRECQKS